MTRLAVLAFAIFACLPSMPPSMPAQAAPDGRDWVQLFNGKDLDGWTVKIAGHELGDNYGNTFRVRDGLLAVSYDQYDDLRRQFGHLFYRGTYWYLPHRCRVPVRGRTGTRRAGMGAAEQRHHGARPAARDDSARTRIFRSRSRCSCWAEAAPASAPRRTCARPERMSSSTARSSPRTASTLNRRRTAASNGCGSRPKCSAPSRITHFVNGEPVLSYEQPQIGGGNVINYDPAVKKDGALLSEGIDLAAVREPPRRVPESGAAEPGRLHGPEGEELQGVLREGRRGELPVPRLRAPGCSLQAPRAADWALARRARRL